VQSPDVPTPAIAKDTFPKDNDVVKTTGSNTSFNTRSKRNVGTYKDKPVKEHQMKQKHLHIYHTPDWQYIKAVKKQDKKHGADNLTMTQAMKKRIGPNFKQLSQRSISK